MSSRLSDSVGMEAVPQSLDVGPSLSYQGAPHGAIFSVSHIVLWPPWGSIKDSVGYGGQNYGGKNLRMEKTPWAGNQPLVLHRGVPPTDYGCYASVCDRGFHVNASESGNCATARDRGCSYDPEKVALVLPLGVLLTGCGQCGIGGDRECNVSLPTTGKGGSDRGSGCYVNRWVGKDAKLWSLGLRSISNLMASCCGHNTMLELELLESTLAHISSQGGIGSRDGLSVHITGLWSNMTDWDQGCKGKLLGSGNCGFDRDRGYKVAPSRSSKFGLYQGSCLLIGPIFESAAPPCGIYKNGARHSNIRGCNMDLSRTGLCRSAPTRLTWTDLPKPYFNVLPRKMDGCWALIELCVLSLMTRPGLCRLCSIDFADYGTYVAALAILFESFLPSWDGFKASLCGEFALAVCKKHTTRFGNKGSNWDRVGRLDTATTGKCGEIQAKGCTVGFNRINSCSSIYVRGCSENLAENGICKPSHGNWLRSGLLSWEVITPFKDEEGCGAFIVKNLLSLLIGPQATRETAYLKVIYLCWNFDPKRSLLMDQGFICFFAFGVAFLTLMDVSNWGQFGNCGLACSILTDTVMPKRALTDFLFKNEDCLAFNGLCILSLNGRSLGNRANYLLRISLSLWNICAVQALTRFVTLNNPDVVFISETRLLKHKVDGIRRRLNMFGCFDVERNDGCCGLLLLWKEGIDVKLLSYSKSHIDTEIEVEIVRTRFTGMYGSFGRPRKHLDWELIDRLKVESQLPWLLGVISMILCVQMKGLELVTGGGLGKAVVFVRLVDSKTWRWSGDDES
ncbi:hypothetical protein V6N13_039828 [Hibiscus sabdariffa]